MAEPALAIEQAPPAVHFGADELPFVDIGEGSQLKVIQVKQGEGLWIVENVFREGYEVQTHKLQAYYALCEAQGFGRPNVLVE